MNENYVLKIDQDKIRSQSFLSSGPKKKVRKSLKSPGI